MPWSGAVLPLVRQAPIPRSLSERSESKRGRTDADSLASSAGWAGLGPVEVRFRVRQRDVRATAHRRNPGDVAEASDRSGVFACKLTA